MTNTEMGTRYQRLFQYFWDPEPRNDDTSGDPIWCLGRSYSNAVGRHNADISASSEGDRQASSETTFEMVDKMPSATNGAAQETLHDTPWPPAFLDDFESLFWLTYRTGFPAIPRSTDASLTIAVRVRNFGETAGFTSDTGWGCMIRSGQSLLSNALGILWLGRDWRRDQRQGDEKRLISLFADDPKAPFSIHKFVAHGALACGKHPGEWFGPSATAQCIEALARSYSQAGLRVYIAAEGAQVYEGSVTKIAESEQSFQPVLILAGIRLGIDRITPTYRKALQSVLQMKQSVGIAGGRPSASHYFVAVQGDNFFYLDPHHPRQAVPWHDLPSDYTEEEVDSCHTRRLRRLSIDKMDPSMLLAFLIQNRDDWEDWKQSISALPETPILHMAKGEPPGDTSSEREDAVDEVEAFDDEEDSDAEPEIISKPEA